MEKLFLLLLSLILFSCKSTKDTSLPHEDMMMKDVGIADNVWKLHSFGGKELSSLGYEGDEMYFKLNSTDSTIIGNSGCNSFRGSFDFDESNKFRFSKLASSRMACPDMIIKEENFLSLFNNQYHFIIEESNLKVVSSESETIAVFTSPLKITGVKWVLQKLGDQEFDKNSAVYFILDEYENRISGYTGCNSFNGSFKLKPGNRIVFSELISTLKACQDIKINESNYLDVFKLSDNYTISNNTLRLQVGRRAPFAIFERQYKIHDEN